MSSKNDRHDANEILNVYEALVLAFDILDNIEAKDCCPTLQELSQDIADLADRVQTLSIKYRRQTQ